MSKLRRQHVCLCGVSVVTLLASTLAVMLIIHTVVVPHLQQQAHVGSLCTITHIITQGTGEQGARRHVAAHSEGTQGHDITTHDHAITNTEDGQDHDFTNAQEIQDHGIKIQDHAVVNDNSTNFVDNNGDVMIAYTRDQRTQKQTGSNTEGKKDHTVASGDVIMSGDGDDTTGYISIPNDIIDNNTNAVILAEEPYSHQHRPHDTRQNAGLPKPDQLQLQKHCVVVTITYYDLDGHLKHGYLQQQQRPINPDHKCFCEECQVVSTPQGIVLELDTRNFTLGDTTACYFRTAPTANGAEIHPTRLSSSAWHARPENATRAAFHAILWPTVLFVLGFVGVFIGSVYVYADQEKNAIRNVAFKISVSGKRRVVV